MGLSIAITADLHWGHRRGKEAAQLLAQYVRERPPDVLVLAGDIGTGSWFGECLALFADVPSRKCLVPGNHDLWVPTDASFDSLAMYDERLPAEAAAHGFHFLDREAMLVPDADVALVGSVNWYDYSWGKEEILRLFPGEEHRLLSKRFTRGQHNDANFVRWPLDDVSFTARIVAEFERQLQAALGRVSRVIVVTHHPAFHGLSFPRNGPPIHLDGFLWDAFSGNRAMEEVLRRHAERIAFAFSGHTHRQRSSEFHGIRGHNIGGDYHYKRLLWLDWPDGTIEEHQFGDPVAH